MQDSIYDRTLTLFLIYNFHKTFCLFKFFQFVIRIMSLLFLIFFPFNYLYPVMLQESLLIKKKWLNAMTID